MAYKTYFMLQRYNASPASYRSLWIVYRIIKLLFSALVIWQILLVFPIFAAEIAVRRERGRSLLLLYPMNGEAQIPVIEQKMEALISTEPDLFLVEVKIKPTNNIKVFIDGDQGISIDKLVRYNRKLYKELEEGGMFPNGDFSLEVSSPGLDEPLKIHRQYLKNIGRFVEVLENDGVKKEGKLVSAEKDNITIEETRGKGKKMETVQHTISIAQIKTTKIQIKF